MFQKCSPLIKICFRFGNLMSGTLGSFEFTLFRQNLFCSVLIFVFFADKLSKTEKAKVKTISDLYSIEFLFHQRQTEIFVQKSLDAFS